MKHLVIGLGEVGTAIVKVLNEKHNVDGLDRNQEVTEKYDVLHICFPYSKQFVPAVKAYQKQLLVKGGLTIIHSTVPVGISKLCKAVHSPIRGIHPNLYEGIMTFVKYFGGPRAEEAASIFKASGLTTFVCQKAEETEMLKMLDTTYYGWNIIFNKIAHKMCKEAKVDFETVYTHANQSYNEGYTKLGLSHVVRPVLKYMQGPIGGHCVLPNCELLGGDAAKFILKMNKRYGV